MASFDEIASPTVSADDPDTRRPRPETASGGSARGLRLALFSGNYNYTRDGANQALNRLVAYLESEGATVRVYSPTTRCPAFEPAGELVSAPSMPIPGRPEYRVALPLSRALREDIARFGPTAIHLSAPDLLGFQALKLGRRLGAPVVSSLHTRFETYLPYYGLGWLRGAAERLLARFYRGCDRVLAPNHALAGLLVDQVPEVEVRVWSRGVDREQFSPLNRSNAWRRSVGIEDGDVAVLFLGRLVMEKGLEIFAETLARLEDLPRVKALIVGDGPAADWFRQRMPQAIFTGQLSGDELGVAVAGADLLFNPSCTEAFGNATLEAMAAGLAVVCPKVPSTSDLIGPGQGVLIADPSPGAYADAIRALALDPAERARLGEAARRRSGDYAWAASCAAVVDAYRELGAMAPAAAPVVRSEPSTARVAAPLALGAFLLLLVLRSTDIHAAASVLGEVRWAALAIVGAHLLVSLSAGLGWRALLRRDERPSLWETLRLRLVKEAVNALLPVAQVGGDVVRARLASGPKLPMKTAAASALADVGVSLICLALFVQVGLAATLAFSADARLHALAQPLAIAGAVLIVLLALAERSGAVRLLERGAKAAGGSLLQLEGVGEEARAMLRTRPWRLGASFGWHLGSWGLGVAETSAAFWALGLPAAPAQALILESLIQGARALGFAIPGALGVQEGGYLLVCAGLGLPAPDALALSVLRRMRELGLGFVGLALWRYGRPRVKTVGL